MVQLFSDAVEADAVEVNFVGNEVSFTEGGQQSVTNWQIEIASLYARLVENERELEELSYRVDLGDADLGGNGIADYVELPPPEDQDQVLEELFNQTPLLQQMFSYSPGSGTSGLRLPEGGLSPGSVSSNKPQSGGSGSGGVIHQPSLPERAGILSPLVRLGGSFLAWLETKRLPVVLLSGGLIVVGLFCLGLAFNVWLMLASNPGPISASLVGGKATATPLGLSMVATPTVLASATANPTFVALSNTVTAQSLSLTAQAGRPTLTPPPPARSVTPVPPTPTLPPLGVAHLGLSAPAKLNVSSISLSLEGIRPAPNNDAVSVKDGRVSVVSPPSKGVVYHVGTYLGEPGNLVLVGDYETLSQFLELIPENELALLTDRNGGVYTYRFMSYDRVDSLIKGDLLELSSSTPPSSVGTGSSSDEATSSPADSGNSVISSAATATAFADQVLSKVRRITTWDDVSLAAPLPEDGRKMYVLTLVGLDKLSSNGDDTGVRYVARAVLIAYKPSDNVPVGTPVALPLVIPTPTSGITATATPSVAG
ncbi:MAG: hypothetical protein WCS37_03260 [Chloroflexota bacterium]